MRAYSEVSVRNSWGYFKFKIGVWYYVLQTLTTHFIGILSVLIPLWIIGNQIFDYLKLGEWSPHSCLKLVAFFIPEWAAEPDAWFGLHTVLSFIPSSLIIFIALIFIHSILIIEVKISSQTHDEKYRKYWDKSYVDKSFKE